MLDLGMLQAAGNALLIILDPVRLAFLAGGALLGLVIGILPGIGGLTGIALLLPFTFAMDPYTAFAFLLGLAATTATGDPIPAVVFGVPGGAGSAATVLDGLPMAKRGEAGRALSACYMSSLMGGLFGAALMAVTIPLMRPIMLSVGSPELLALAVLGLSMVAVLSGNAPLRGLTAAGLGLLLAAIGSDPQTATQRWTFGSDYLWEGLPLVPVVLGLFALPELCDLAINRSSITGKAQRICIRGGMWQGAKDCFAHWWLVIRCSWIGAGLGALPGIGGSVIDWLAYGHALRTEKDARRTFGTGDVRGVIASESANNAKEGGALIPTVAFGVPGSAGMAILLGAFLMHGLVPGPDMLSKHLDLTYSMVWSIAVANIVGAGMCYLFSNQFARLATLRFSLIMPAALCIIYVGAYQGSKHWADLAVLLGFGALGWTMKQLRWPRPPLILGFVLGEIIERNLFISISRYGMQWLAHPIVLIVLGLAAWGLLRSLRDDVRRFGGMRAALAGFGAPRLRAAHAFPAAIVAVIVVTIWSASKWSFAAGIVPLVVAATALVAVALSVVVDACRHQPPAADTAKGEGRPVKIHMDLASDTGHLPLATVLRRGLGFFGWLIAFIESMALIGLLPTVPLFVVAYMRIEGRERWGLALGQAVVLTLFIYGLFDRVLHVPWPSTLLGHLFPALRAIPSM